MNTGNVFVLFLAGCYMNLLTYFTSFLVMELPVIKLKYLQLDPLNAKLNPICHLLELLGTHRILH